MENNRQSLISYVLAGVFFLSICFLAYVPAQNDFKQILPSYLIPFCVYLFFVFTPFGKSNFKLGIALAIICRFVLIFSFPNLSDDIYRFIWDGNLIENGVNPFDLLPMEALNEGYQGIDKELFNELNSKEYFTVYPPVCQGIFGLSSLLSEGISLPAYFMKSLMFLFELGSIFFILQALELCKLPKSNVLIYALNPLIIIEVMGNIHFEGAMIFFLLLCFYLLLKDKLWLAGVSMALSICSKLLPLMFLPSLLNKLGFKKSVAFYLVSGLVIMLLFYPLISGMFFENFANSVDLYFRKFEFNASIYYLLRWLGELLVGYNLISMFGPMLGLLSFFSILALAFLLGKSDLKAWPLVMLFSVSVYLFLTTTVHPWYLSLPIVLCLFTRFRFPIIWSGLIMLTYANYAAAEYQENLLIVGIEYSIVFTFLIYELWKFRKTAASR